MLGLPCLQRVVLPVVWPTFTQRPVTLLALQGHGTVQCLKQPYDSSVAIHLFECLSTFAEQIACASDCICGDVQLVSTRCFDFHLLLSGTAL
jgi:hypothetical protein